MSERTIPVGWQAHSNGGGLVQDTASVADTAYIGIGASVSDSASVSGFAIDTHALQAAMNDPIKFIGLHATAYGIFASVYASVARDLGHKPCDFQAIIWCAWKRRYPRMRKRALSRARKERHV